LGFEITNRDVFSSGRFGLELAAALAKLYPGRIDWEANRKLIGSGAVMSALSAGADPLGASAAGIAEFMAIRDKYLLYR
jgi:hypothetical protein